MLTFIYIWPFLSETFAPKWRTTSCRLMPTLTRRWLWGWGTWSRPSSCKWCPLFPRITTRTCRPWWFSSSIWRSVKVPCGVRYVAWGYPTVTGGQVFFFFLPPFCIFGGLNQRLSSLTCFCPLPLRLEQCSFSAWNSAYFDSRYAAVFTNGQVYLCCFLLRCSDFLFAKSTRVIF